MALARAFEVLLVALRLGLTSFGGPVAHIGYFRDEYVTRRRWLDDAAYADLVALCQLLPGPASSQVGIAVGMHRAGIPGGIAAWVGFTAPSAAALILLGYGVAAFDHLVAQGWLRGLKVVAAAVVAFALLGMARNLAPDARRATIAIAAAIAMLLWRTPLAQVLVIVIAGVVGRLVLSGVVRPAEAGAWRARGTPAVAAVSLALFVVLLAGLPVVRQFVTSDAARRLRRLLSIGIAGVRRRPRGAAPAAGGGRAARMGDRASSSSPATARRKPFPVHCSRSRRIWGR